MNVRRQRHVSQRIQPLLKIRHRRKAQRPLSALACGDNFRVKTHILGHARKLDPIAHAQLASGLHQRVPLPCIDLFREQYFNASRRRFRLIRSPGSSAVQARRNHTRVVQYQHVSRAQQRWEMGEDIIPPSAGPAIHQQHARIAAFLRRLLRNQLLGQIEIKLRNQHSPILV